ncbi:MAG: SpoIID/LytB domain-containing protein [Myxococcota bacterium]
MAGKVGLGRGGAALLALLHAVAATAAADEVEAKEPTVRVLLFSTGGSVRLDTAEGPVTLAPSGRGLAVDGRAVGQAWRVPTGRDAGPLRVDGLRVQGGLEARRVDGGLQMINRVGLEAYVAGTLGREVYPGWHPEMLKAQAVVTRTYALHQMARKAESPFDLRAGTDSQVYGGLDAETPSVRRAVRATRGEFLTYRREPILAVFHSASGGRTAAADEVWGEPIPYLVSLPVENEEDSPDTYWRVSVSRTTLGRALAPAGIQVGSIQEVEVAERSASGRARRVRIRGTEGSRALEARALRTALGLAVIRSTMFEIRSSQDDIIFVGSGHGHGVGMSQWGAQAMAQAGAGYRDILESFYPGTSVNQGAYR